MEGSEYVLIQRAREQNRERKLIQREIMRLNSRDDGDVEAQHQMTDKECALH